jgi:hypothetical protein
MQQTVAGSGLWVDELSAQSQSCLYFALPKSGVKSGPWRFAEMENAAGNLAFGRVEAVSQQLVLVGKYGNYLAIVGIGKNFHGPAEDPGVAVGYRAIAAAFEDELSEHGAKIGDALLRC